MWLKDGAQIVSIDRVFQSDFWSVGVLLQNDAIPAERFFLNFKSGDQAPDTPTITSTISTVVDAKNAEVQRIQAELNDKNNSITVFFPSLQRRDQVVATLKALAPNIIDRILDGKSEKL